MDDGPPTLDESEVSKSTLGDSNRSGYDDIISRFSSYHKMQEAKTMEEECGEEQAGGDGTREIPIATPASAQENSRASISGRMKTSICPPLPMATVSVATPASTQENSRTSIRSRMEASIPSRPMAAASSSFATVANHISPATPMPPPVGIAGIRRGNMSRDLNDTPPGSAHSQDSAGRAALAALYQSSRRSRNNTPQTSSAAMPTPVTFPPPPPLFSASDTDAGNRKIDSTVPLRSSGGSPAHNVSLQSSNASSFLHESWNTSMSSLMTSSFMNASLSNVYNPRLSASVASQGQGIARPGARPPPTGETRKRPNRASLMDFKIEDRTSNRRLSDESQSQGGHGSNASSDNSLSLHEATAAKKKKSRPVLNKMRLNLMDYKFEGSGDEEESGKSPPPAVPTIPTLSGDSNETESLRAPPSPSAGFAERMSSLNVGAKRKGSDESTVEDEVDAESATGEDFVRDEAGSIGKGIDASNRGGEEDEDKDSQGPPKKKNKMQTVPTFAAAGAEPQEEYYLTPQTHKSCMSSASFDIIAHPSSRVSSIHEGVDSSPPISDVDMLELLKSDVGVNEPYEANAEEDHEMGVQRMKEEEGARQELQQDGEDPEAPMVEGQGGPREDQKIQEEDRAEPKRRVRTHKDEEPSVKEQRILRRKIQRLLLIRHCSTCAIPPPPLVTIRGPSSKSITPSSGLPDRCGPCEDEADNNEDSAPPQASSGVMVCPVTSHCAEGKALCAHIRTCQVEGCKYKKCLTSREVLGHYKGCRDRACEICGPVRALDRRHHRGGLRGNDGNQRRKSDSSIETIDDEGWLNANMMESDHYR